MEKREKLFEIRIVELRDRDAWLALDRHIDESVFDEKVRQKRGYSLFDGENLVGLLRYSLFWETSRSAICSIWRSGRAGRAAAAR